MISAQDMGQIPIECFAKKGSNCVNAVIAKIMVCDKSRMHHHPTCIGGNSFGDCYDRVHTPQQASLQSWGGWITCGVDNQLVETTIIEMGHSSLSKVVCSLQVHICFDLVET